MGRVVELVEAPEAFLELLGPPDRVVGTLVTFQHRCLGFGVIARFLQQRPPEIAGVVARQRKPGLGELGPADRCCDCLVEVVRSGRSALPAFRLAGFSGPSPEPDVRLPPLCRVRHNDDYVE